MKIPKLVFAKILSIDWISPMLYPCHDHHSYSSPIPGTFEDTSNVLALKTLVVPVEDFEISHGLCLTNLPLMFEVKLLRSRRYQSIFHDISSPRSATYDQFPTAKTTPSCPIFGFKPCRDTNVAIYAFAREC